MKTKIGKAISEVLLSLLSLQVHADSTELIFGSLSYHIINTGAKKYYKYKTSLTPNLITNPLIGIRFNDKISQTIFYGKNSIAEPMCGYLAFFGHGKSIRQGIVAGFYYQNTKKFRDHHIIMFKEFKDSNIIPLVGYEFDFKFKLGKNYYLSENNVLTPIITNHTLSIGMNF